MGWYVARNYDVWGQPPSSILNDAIAGSTFACLTVHIFKIVCFLYLQRCPSTAYLTVSSKMSLLGMVDTTVLSKMPLLNMCDRIFKGLCVLDSPCLQNCLLSVSSKMPLPSIIDSLSENVPPHSLACLTVPSKMPFPNLCDSISKDVSMGHA